MKTRARACPASFSPRGAAITQLRDDDEVGEFLAWKLEKTAAKLRCPKSSPLAALRFPKLALVWVDRGGHTRRNWLMDMVFVLCSVAQPWFYLALCTDRCQMRDRRLCFFPNISPAAWSEELRDGLLHARAFVPAVSLHSPALT
jgi:hypothetical protein